MNVFSLSVILFFVVVWGQHAGCRLLGLLRSALESLCLRTCALDGSRSLVQHRGVDLSTPMAEEEVLVAEVVRWGLCDSALAPGWVSPVYAPRPAGEGGRICGFLLRIGAVL